MFSEKELDKEIKAVRDARISEEDFIASFYELLESHETKQDYIAKNITTAKAEHALHLGLLNPNQIFHIDDIQQIARVFRLRFLDIKYFKAEIPTEAYQKIQDLEEQHQTKLGGFKILAPAKLLQLESAEDPLLFIPLQNKYYYLIHKWGKDIKPYRKWLMWPMQTYKHMLVCVLLASIVLTLVLLLFIKNWTAQTALLQFMYNFQALIGLTAFYMISFGKNFSKNN